MPAKDYVVHGLIRRSSTFNTARIDHPYRDPHGPEARLFLHYGGHTDGSRLVTLLERIGPTEIYHGILFDHESLPRGETFVKRKISMAVAATERSYSVGDFVGMAFEYVELDWEKSVKFDLRYLRPTSQVFLDVFAAYVALVRISRYLLGVRVRVVGSGRMERKRKRTRRPWESRSIRIAGASVLVSSGLLGSYVAAYRSPRAWAAGTYSCTYLVGEVSTDDSLNAAIAQINLGNCNIIELTSDITLDGDLTPIDISNLDDTVESSVTIQSDSVPRTVSGNSTFKGFSVAGALASPSYLGLILEGVTLEDFRRTAAGYGGAALSVDVNNSFSVFLRNVQLTGNSSDDSGGAVSLQSLGQVNLITDDSVTFQSNSAGVGAGGALYLNSGGGDVQIQVGFGNEAYLGFINNTASSSDGGAIASTTGLDFGGIAFSGNSAVLGRGGAISADGFVDMSGTTFTNNQALEGGAVFSTDEIDSRDNYFSGNAALAGKGGALRASTVDIYLDEFRLNTSDDSVGTAVAGGGAIYALISVTSEESVFVSNSVQGGSGGAVHAPALSSLDDSFALNTADDSGGAIHASSGALSVNRGEFSGNSASIGGAVYQTGGMFNLSDSLFASNTAQEGGAIHQRVSRLYVENSRFEGNSATSSGGAIYSSVDTASDSTYQLVIDASTFRANTADDSGGGIFFNPQSSSGLFSAAGVWFDDNYAPESGAIHSTDGSVQIQLALFSGNDASVRAGAVGDDSGSMKLEAVTFLNNGDDTTPSIGGAVVGPVTGYTYLGNVTAIGNRATSRGGFAYFRGGTSARPDEVIFSTVTGNSLVSGPSAGIDASSTAVTTVANSVVQGNSEGAGIYDLYLPATGSSLTYSFVSSEYSVDPTALGSGIGVLFGSNPGLGAVTNNGGYPVGAPRDDTYLPTREPQAGSPLIGAAQSVSPLSQVTFDAVGTPRSTTGPNAIGAIQVAAPTPPTPTPVVAGPPREVIATAGDREVTVTWQAPASSGSFPVSTYQMTASPGGASCVVPAAELTCVITGLTNGVEYTIRGRALNGAGWSAFSAASAPVTPIRPEPVQTIVITGSRTGRNVQVVGETTGLVGERVTPWIRFPGQARYTAGEGVRTVSADGVFTWQRVTRKKIYVYFRAESSGETDGVRSNRVIIPAP